MVRARVIGAARGGLVAPRLPLEPLSYATASGSWIEASDGRRYLDGSSGLVCVNIGHAHPHVVAALADQAARSTFASPGMFEPELQEAYAQRLTAAVGRPDDGVFISCTGTAANELAVALARSIQRARGEPGRHKVLTGSLSYHGNSALMLALSGHNRRRPHPDDSFGLAPAFASPYPGHHPECDYGICRDDCADAVGRAIDATGPETVAAVLVEPVNGTTGGGFTPPPGYLRRLRSVCESRGVLVIHDEVLTGLGRTGLPLAADACEGAQADITVLSKGLGAGYVAISAVLVARPLLDALRDNGAATPMMGTMSATPLQARVGLAILDVLSEIGALTPHVRRGDGVLRAVRHATDDSPLVVDVRGQGYFLGLELATGAQLTVLATARRNGLLLYPFNGFRPDGGGEGVIVAPPINISDPELAFLAGSLRTSLHDAARARARANDEGET